jgi:PAS domain S-box-containing protein
MGNNNRRAVMAAWSIGSVAGWSLFTAHSKLNHYIERAEQMAAEHPGHVVKVIDDTDRVIYASPSHLLLLGFEAAALLGCTLQQLVARDDLAIVNLSTQDAVLTSRAVDVHFRHRTADGHYVELRRMAWAMPGDAASRYYVLTRAYPADA